MATHRPDRSHYAATPLTWREYGLILMQLGLLTTLVWQFHMEDSRHLLTAMLLGTGGFAIHALLPPRFRGPAFVALSVGAIALVLGFQEAAKLLAIAAGLILIARLPVAWIVRVILLGVAGIGLVWLRRDSSDMFWPIVGSMFMFRLLIYMQAERQQAPSSSLMETGAYFLMWPNVFFPLFPVVDFRTFQDTHYNAERRQIYQGGIHWLTMGLGHLVLYRFIKHELLPSPLEIRSLTDTALFLSMNYALYLRVSGHFHVICGLLHLFGYNLPRTHECYFLASSFSDVWRRINIYWKDFMMKSVFFPAFFQTRRWGNLYGVGCAVLWVFLWTWLAHSWQVFWLIDAFPFRAADAALWLGVGGLVAINAMLDYRRAAAPRPPVALTIPGATVRALQTLGVFTCVSLFWAHWGNPDVFEMLVLGTSIMAVTTGDVVNLTIAVLIAIAVVTALQFLKPRMKDATTLPFEQSVGWHLVAASALLVVAQPPIYQIFGPGTSKMLADLQIERANRGEALAIIDGYYEELNDRSLQSGPFLGKVSPKKAVAAVDFGDMIQYRDDVLEQELIPNWTGKWADATITTNRWGMRDRERSIVKPRGTVRIAMVGSSLVMGFGVGDEQTFSRLLEDRLNRDAGAAGRRYEVLNFGVGRYSPLHRRLQIEHKVLPFEPDLIVYFAHQDEVYASARRLATVAYRRMDLEDPCLDELIAGMNLDGLASEATFQVAAEQRHFAILRCLYRRIAERCRAANAKLLFVYLPIPGEHDLPFDPKICLTIASDFGIDTVDFQDWQEGRAPKDVLLGEADYHPNPFGHQLLAERLVRFLQQRPGLLEAAAAR